MYCDLWGGCRLGLDTVITAEQCWRGEKRWRHQESEVFLNPSCGDSTFFRRRLGVISPDAMMKKRSASARGCSSQSRYGFCGVRDRTCACGGIDSTERAKESGNGRLGAATKELARTGAGLRNRAERYEHSNRKFEPSYRAKTKMIMTINLDAAPDSHSTRPSVSCSHHLPFMKVKVGFQ